MEKIKTKVSAIILGVSLLTSCVKADIIGTFDYNTKFYKILKKNFPNYKFNGWKLSFKNAFFDIQTNTYWNLDIFHNVLGSSASLVDFLEKYSYFDRKTRQNTIIYIFKSKKLDNKFVYLLFKDGSLKVASFVSPGDKDHKTPRWKFETSGKYLSKRSKKYNGYPMPFAVHLDGGFFIHWGKVVTGYGKSHGCFRLPGLASWINFKNIRVNEKIPVIFTGYDVSF